MKMKKSQLAYTIWHNGQAVLQTDSSNTQIDILLLHGIMGSKQNLASFAKALSSTLPHFRFICIDLPHHGASQGFGQPYTLMACVKVIKEQALLEKWNIQAVIGHSFGGKVALLYAKHVSLKAVWVLDSSLDVCLAEQVSAQAESLLNLMDTFKAIAMPIESRQALINELQNRQVSLPIAQWMTTNLKDDEFGRLIWRLDFDVMRQLLLNYYQIDGWELLSALSEKIDVFVIKGEYSKRLDANAEHRLLELGKTNKVHFSILPKSGHFVHMDNPKKLLELAQNGLSKIFL